MTKNNDLDNIPKDFQSDCLAYMLFNGSNLSAGADNIEWENQEWSLVNHFIPFTPQDLCLPPTTVFQSDFMITHIKENNIT